MAAVARNVTEQEENCQLGASLI
ncbi:uncharacterized, partial [Tachysurus ichikawai]